MRDVWVLGCEGCVRGVRDMWVLGCKGYAGCEGCEFPEAEAVHTEVLACGEAENSCLVCGRDT